jgi:hypothetical protein
LLPRLQFHLNRYAQLSLLRCGQILGVVLAVQREQPHLLIRGKVQVDNTQSSALPFPSGVVNPAQLPKSAGARHHFAGLWPLGKEQLYANMTREEVPICRRGRRLVHWGVADPASLSPVPVRRSCDRGWTSWAFPSLVYRPRSPEQEVLHTLVRDHYETFRAQAAGRRDGQGLPRFVERAGHPERSRGVAASRPASQGFDAQRVGTSGS